jgi:hypothetical protein
MMSHQILHQTIDLINSISEYFENTKNILLSVDENKYNEIIQLISKSEENKAIIEEFIANHDLKGDKEIIDEIFKKIHVLNQLKYIINKMYTLMDIKFDINIDVSKTKASNLNTWFNEISTIYSKYIKNVESNLNIIESEYFDSLSNSEINLEDMNKLFYKYPYAINIYILLMNHYLDMAYRNKDNDKIQLILKLRENDKSHALGEKKWSSIQLSLNMVPQTELQSIENLMKYVNHKDLNKIKSQSQLIEYFQNQTGKCLLLIIREQLQNCIHKLPSDKPESVISIFNTNNIKWSHKLYFGGTKDSIKEYLCIEILNDDLKDTKARILGPWNINRKKYWIDSSKLHKFTEQQYGRPEAYHKLLDKVLLTKINKNISQLVNEHVPKIDMGINLTKIHANYMIMIKEIVKNGKIDETKINSDEFDQIFQSAFLNILEPGPLVIETMIFLLNWLGKQYTKELLNRYKFDKDILKDKPTWFEKTSHDVMKYMLLKNDNIFHIIDRKNYFINKLDQIEK